MAAAVISEAPGFLETMALLPVVFLSRWHFERFVSYCEGTLRLRDNLLYK